MSLHIGLFSGPAGKKEECSFVFRGSAYGLELFPGKKPCREPQVIVRVCGSYFFNVDPNRVTFGQGAQRVFAGVRQVEFERWLMRVCEAWLAVGAIRKPYGFCLCSEILTENRAQAASCQGEVPSVFGASKASGALALIGRKRLFVFLKTIPYVGERNRPEINGFVTNLHSFRFIRYAGLQSDPTWPPSMPVQHPLPDR